MTIGVLVIQSRFTRPWLLTVILSVAALVGAESPARAQASTVDPASQLQPSYFGTRELRSADLAAFKQWNGAMERFSKERAEKLEGSCEEKRFNACNYSKLMQFLNGIKSKDRHTQLVEINALVNKAKYISDDANWSQKDYWNSPGEFMAKFGDCEDFAIAKFVALSVIGFPPDSLRVVAVKDLNLKVGHAILIVLLEGKAYVLDNQIPQVIEATKVRHYDPVFSINQKYWWRHVR